MKSYYPILFAKLGELNALKNLDLDVKEGITPLFKMLPPDDTPRKPRKDGKEHKPLKPVDEKLSEFLIKHWSFDNNSVLIDASHLGFVSTRFFNGLLQNGVNAVPVVCVNSSARYINTVKAILPDVDKICFRLSNETGGLVDVQAAINSLSAEYDVSPSEVILVVDLGASNEQNNELLLGVALKILSSIKSASSYDSIIFATGSIPETMEKFTRGVRSAIKRFDYIIWEELLTKYKYKNLKYGDYGAKNPGFNPDAKYEGTATLKYTTKGEYVFYKGIKPSEHADGFGQMIEHCQKLVKSSDFLGMDYSWGDAEIYERAAGISTKGKGNSTNWIEISHNHHLTLQYRLL